MSTQRVKELKRRRKRRRESLKARKKPARATRTIGQAAAVGKGGAKPAAPKPAARRSTAKSAEAKPAPPPETGE
jgi:hypothetical protein